MSRHMFADDLRKTLKADTLAAANYRSAEAWERCFACKSSEVRGAGAKIDLHCHTFKSPVHFAKVCDRYNQHPNVTLAKPVEAK